MYAHEIENQRLRADCCGRAMNHVHLSPLSVSYNGFSEPVLSSCMRELDVLRWNEQVCLGAFYVLMEDSGHRGMSWCSLDSNLHLHWSRITCRVSSATYSKHWTIPSPPCAALIWSNDVNSIRQLLQAVLVFIVVRHNVINEADSSWWANNMQCAYLNISHI